MNADTAYTVNLIQKGLLYKEGDGKSCVIIKDEWALIVKEELKKAKDFKVKGSWRGTRSIQCCGKK